MTIRLRVICQEILGAMPGGEYAVPDGSNARSALLSCISQYDGGDVREDCVDHVVYMCNGKHISADTLLNENDQLMVLRPVYGG